MIFQSITEALEAVKGPCVLEQNEVRIQEMRDRTSYVMFSKTLAQVELELNNIPRRIQLAIDEMVYKVKDSVPAPQRKRKRVKRNQAEGDDFCIDKFRDREFDTMWTTTYRAFDNAKCVRLGINLSEHAGANQSSLMWRGAAICALIELYEELGIQTELTAFDATDFTTHKLLFELRLKQQNETYDKNKIALATCDMDFYRRVCLSAICARASFIVPDDHGRARTLSYEEQMDYDFVIDRDVRSEEQAIKFVKGSISDVNY